MKARLDKEYILPGNKERVKRDAKAFCSEMSEGELLCFWKAETGELEPHGHIIKADVEAFDKGVYYPGVTSFKVEMVVTDYYTHFWTIRFYVQYKHEEGYRISTEVPYDLKSFEIVKEG